MGKKNYQDYRHDGDIKNKTNAMQFPTQNNTTAQPCIIIQQTFLNRT